MPTARYQHKPTQVTAIQYTGSNEREVERFLGPIALPADLAAAGEKILSMATAAGPVQLSPGCWVLRDDSDNTYSALTSAQFEALYEPAGGSPPPGARLHPVAPAVAEEPPPPPDVPFDVEVEDLLEHRIAAAGEDPVLLGSLLAAIGRLRDSLAEQEERVGAQVQASRQLARAR